MGFLICDKCGGYYELQPGEKPEDFSSECECGGHLNYSDSLDYNPEVESELDSEIEIESGIQSQRDSEITEDEDISLSYEDESGSNDGRTTIEEEQADLTTQSKRIEIKLATELLEILETKGYYVIKGGLKNSIKILPDGIKTDDGQFIPLNDIISVKEYVDDTEVKENEIPKKSAIDGLLATASELLASRKRTLKITYSNGEILLKDVKKRDAKRFVSFVNRRNNFKKT
ncbi:MAG: hypothetical protein HVN35_11195 [Methanobacteriaceae archaeon]|nr:hypothetical protein [Methanobacteriaceae archaeon]